MKSELFGRRGWLFDLDGTLIDSSEGVVLAFHTAQRTLGESPADPEAIKRRIGYPLSETISTLSRLPVEPFLKEFRAEALRSMAQHSTLLPGAWELLSALESRRRVLAVVTSKRRDVAWGILDRLSILGFFQTVVGADSASAIKPSPEPLREAARRLGLPADELIMVGDTRNDLEAASGAGIPVIALSSGVDPASALSGADLLLGSALELRYLVDQYEPASRPRLLVHSRFDCPLCDELKERLHARKVRFEERDIRGSDVWYDLFSLRVPVVRAGHLEFDPPFADELLDQWSVQYP